MDDISVESPDEDPEATIERTKRLEDLEPFSVLILGTDVETEEDRNRSRSDTIIVATINPKSSDIKMVSIPRDTLITLPDGRMEKMNAAYATGGIMRARDQVSEFLDIPIDYYAIMDFTGLIELVDAVGGITVNSDFAFTENNYLHPGQKVEIEEGIQRLNGDEALGYARMRKKDPRGDFGRQDRQQEVIVGILDELASLNTITNFTEILNSVRPYLLTNAKADQMFAIAGNYAHTISDIEQLSINGYDDREYFPHYGFEVYVWKPYEESLLEVQNELRVHLNLEEPADSDDEESEEENEFEGYTEYQVDESEASTVY
jgi:LCP family protein required for cell wall assembly